MNSISIFPEGDAFGKGLKRVLKKHKKDPPIVGVVLSPTGRQEKRELDKMFLTVYLGGDFSMAKKRDKPFKPIQKN
ncbi:hypothetical protein [Peribacillus sp. NPDC096540]|uniref:hypothetical protein n=1 Tax=Peribacillus sp. NPDC096540 TaxID=3390612 RepID=UPI003D012F5E